MFFFSCVWIEYVGFNNEKSFCHSSSTIKIMKINLIWKDSSFHWNCVVGLCEDLEFVFFFVKMKAYWIGSILWKLVDTVTFVSYGIKKVEDILVFYFVCSVLIGFDEFGEDKCWDDHFIVTLSYVNTIIFLFEILTLICYRGTLVVVLMLWFQFFFLCLCI